MTSKKHLITFLICASFIQGFSQIKTSVLEDINSSLKKSILEQTYPKREFRAAWVTTFTNLDWPSKGGLSSGEQKKEFVKLVQNFKNSRMNAVVVQVRASSDAFYESKYSPWSEWLSGKQGVAPSPYYDPLEFMLKECHYNNLEFHAWFNPLRAISHDRFSSVVKNHITARKPAWFFHYGESYYYNPGIPEVRDYIVEVIMEVVRNYDVDGIHLDDYFYPYSIKGQKIKDWGTFKKYGRGIKNIHDWRRDNINLLIEQISKAIKKEKPWVKFGISPLAIWRNKKQDPLGSETNSGQTSYDNLYCDTKLWVKNGWMDYIAPQMYWSTDNLYANYHKLLKWWNDETQENMHLYIGHALYKLAPGIRHSFKTTELINQVKINRTNSRSQGSIYFRASAFQHNYQNFQSKFRNSIYKYPAAVPTMPWIDNKPPKGPIRLHVKYSNSAIHLEWLPSRSFDPMDEARYYGVYKFKGTVKQPVLSSKNLLEFSRSAALLDFDVKRGETYTYVITTFDRLHNESLNFVSKTITVY